jgi:UDP-glucose 4-epimerase
VEARNPDLRVVRLRPALIFKRTSAAEQRRLFGGPLLPGSLLRPALIPVLPVTDRLVFQCVHADDVAEAYRLAVVGDARGPFNIAADPVLDPVRLGEIFRARTFSVPEPVFRWGADVSWRLHLQPTPCDWVDMAFESPLLDTTRARAELGWQPTVGADDTLRELLGGMNDGAGEPTPPLREGARL